jgi:2-polyprenyl-3-methyl-5-hydroxy-6-metoxy-1,4-benzoquinol methylase
MMRAEYCYDTPEFNASHSYLLPEVEKIVRDLKPSRIFDLGCGNGSIANVLSKYAIVEGIDVSESAIFQANSAYPHLKLERGSAYDDLAAKYGTYPVVISLEVVEHLYDPRAYAATMRDLLEPGGTGIVSTPYHGYTKNVIMAVTGKMDKHFTALWDGGHIKFWSMRTLSELLRESGFVDISFHRVGRIPPVAKSMIAVARRSH